MKILRVERHSKEELFEKLRKVTLLNRPNVLIYANSSLELKEFKAKDLAPAQRYVLIPGLEKIRALLCALIQHYVNLFRLDGYITIYIEGFEPIDVLPPIIELSKEKDGKVYNLINDGMHRIFLAKLLNMPIQCVLIGNIPAAFPYYALPLPNGWNGIEQLPALPAGYKKKEYRDLPPEAAPEGKDVAESYEVYRAFDTAFTKVGEPRPLGVG